MKNSSARLLARSGGFLMLSGLALAAISHCSVTTTSGDNSNGGTGGSEGGEAGDDGAGGSASGSGGSGGSDAATGGTSGVGATGGSGGSDSGGSGAAGSGADGGAGGSGASGGSGATGGSGGSGSRCPDAMVYIPGGAYQTEVERVIVSEFCIDVNLVTMQEYVDCPDCSPAGNDEGAAGFSEYCNRDHDFRGGDPANCVDALQAEYYCDRNDKELPDEAQWEWAARGGPDANLYPWGATVPTDSDDPQRLCWIAGRSAAAWPNRPQGTCPVGSYDQAASHPYGLEDMSGNVWQWTTSSESAGNRVVRGGGWDNTSATRMTTAFRNTPIPETVVHAAVGFRCVADPLM